MAHIRKVYRSTSIDCTIIERDNRHEQDAQTRRVILIRREQDVSGAWHSSTRFKPEDLPVMIELLSRAHRELLLLDIDDSHERPVDLEAIDRPELKHLHDAILASQIQG